MGLKKSRELLFKTWDRAKQLESERQECLKLLRSHSIFRRIFQYKKFTALRERIRAYEFERSATTIMALGMARELRRLKKKAGLK